MQIKKNETLKNRTWWKVGGPAEYFCQPETIQQVREALQWAEINCQNWTVLGAGTNVLINDQGVKGLVISTAKLNNLSVEQKSNKILITGLAGTLKSQLMKIFKSYKLAPALFLSGLPGDIGGGIVMNAGVNRNFKPSDFSEIIHSFKVITHENTKTYNKNEIQWSYRCSSGWQKGVIYSAQFEWPLKEIKNLNEQIKLEMQKRRSSQPLDKASCGSVFKNPKGQFAGELIEKAGLKGLKRGSAQISEKHANFIINLGSAKAQDIHFLIKEIQTKVYNQFAVSLEPEVRYMGRWEKSVVR